MGVVYGQETRIAPICNDHLQPIFHLSERPDLSRKRCQGDITYTVRSFLRHCRQQCLKFIRWQVRSRSSIPRLGTCLQEQQCSNTYVTCIWPFLRALSPQASKRQVNGSIVNLVSPLPRCLTSILKRIRRWFPISIKFSLVRCRRFRSVVVARFCITPGLAAPSQSIPMLKTTSLPSMLRRESQALTFLIRALQGM